MHCYRQHTTINNTATVNFKIKKQTQNTILMSFRPTRRFEEIRMCLRNTLSQEEAKQVFLHSLLDKINGIQQTSDEWQNKYASFFQTAHEMMVGENVHIRVEGQLENEQKEGQ